MLNFNFLEKSLGLVSSPHFGYDVSRKLFLIVSHLITDQISLFEIAFTSRNIAEYLFVNQAVMP